MENRKEILQNLYNLRKNEKEYIAQLSSEEKKFYDELSREDKNFCLELEFSEAGKELKYNLEKLKYNLENYPLKSGKNKKTIKLSQKFREPANGREYTSDLEKVVEDLSSMPFKKEIQIRHKGEDSWVGYYRFVYGKKEKKDKSGVPYEEDFGTKKGIPIKTMGQLKKQIKKSLKLENPDFKVEYQELEMYDGGFLSLPTFMKVGHGGLHKIKKITLNEKNSSTYIQTKFLDKGLVEIAFNFDLRSNAKELDRINLGISELQKRGYVVNNSSQQI